MNAKADIDAETIFSPFVLTVVGCCYVVLAFICLSVNVILLVSGWFLYIGLSLSLALDRLLFFVIGSREKCSAASMIVLGFSWLLALAYLVAFLLPDFDFGYCCSHSYLHWFYTEENGAVILKKTEIVVDFSVLSLIFILYFVLFLFLMKMRKVAKTKVQMQSFKVELRILIVAAFSFVYESTYLLWFFWGVNLLPNSPYRHIITTFLWIIDSGFFAVSTLLFTSSLRERVKRIVTTSRTTTISRF
uniref:G_PROTEIN_RECEP_F1_2 domain-containing protein n=1 Tax=Steinernema glaseri TaxID=37863 RepID=A0A1I7ZS99_9BILA